MRLIHCADLHLDSKLNRYLSAEKARERNGELLQTFQRMVCFAREHQVSGILIAGDLMDTGKVSAVTRQVILSEIRENREMDFYYLKGNHDKNTFLLDEGEIPENLKMFGFRWTSYVVNPNGNQNITVTAVEWNLENAKAVYGSLELNPEYFNIVMLHGQDAQYKGKENGELIRLPELRDKGIDYLALGHIHGYKEGRLDYRGMYCYPGCLEGRGFDECGEHGFVLLDIDEYTLTYTREFVPFAKRSLYEVSIDISSCTTFDEIIRKIEMELSYGTYGKECLLKLVLTGDVSVECEKNLAHIQQYFQQKYYFVKAEDQTKIRADYGAFSFDESLKGEFVRTVLQDNSLEEDEKAQIIRYGICALAGEEF